MCTVTYIPAESGYFLTSNRDEKSTRSTAISPKIYYHKNTKLIFPKDPDASGTWIVAKENGDSLCLLNGAFTNFIDNGNYKTSRGLIVLDIASSENLKDRFDKIDLDFVAPFTLLICSKIELYECRWDGENKFIFNLDKTKPHIWSSATLYDEVQREKRKNWFNKFVNLNSNFTQEEIICFHKNTGDGNVENDLVMNRDNKYFTVSITSIVVVENNVQMQYQNLITNDKSVVKFSNELELQ